jgi:hypothetical protein
MPNENVALSNIFEYSLSTEPSAAETASHPACHERNQQGVIPGIERLSPGRGAATLSGYNKGCGRQPKMFAKSAQTSLMNSPRFPHLASPSERITEGTKCASRYVERRRRRRAALKLRFGVGEIEVERVGPRSNRPRPTVLMP